MNQTDCAIQATIKFYMTREYTLVPAVTKGVFEIHENGAKIGSVCRHWLDGETWVMSLASEPIGEARNLAAVPEIFRAEQIKSALQVI